MTHFFGSSNSKQKVSSGPVDGLGASGSSSLQALGNKSEQNLNEGNEGEILVMMIMMKVLMKVFLQQRILKKILLVSFWII